MGLGFAYVRWDQGASLEAARTVTFFIACYGQMIFALGCRNEELTYPQTGLFTNRAMLGAIMISGTLQMGTVALPAARGLFGTVPLSLDQWILVGLLSLLPITVIEVAKLVHRRPGVTA